MKATLTIFTFLLFSSTLIFADEAANNSDLENALAKIELIKIERQAQIHAQRDGIDDSDDDSYDDSIPESVRELNLVRSMTNIPFDQELIRQRLHGLDLVAVKAKKGQYVHKKGKGYMPRNDEVMTEADAACQFLTNSPYAKASGKVFLTQKKESPSSQNLTGRALMIPKDNHLKRFVDLRWDFTQPLEYEAIAPYIHDGNSKDKVHVFKKLNCKIIAEPESELATKIMEGVNSSFSYIKEGKYSVVQAATAYSTTVAYEETKVSENQRKARIVSGAGNTMDVQHSGQSKFLRGVWVK